MEHASAFKLTRQIGAPPACLVCIGETSWRLLLPNRSNTAPTYVIMRKDVYHLGIHCMLHECIGTCSALRSQAAEVVGRHVKRPYLIVD